MAHEQTTVSAADLTQAQLDTLRHLSGATIDCEGFAMVGLRHVGHATCRRLAARGLVELRDAADSAYGAGVKLTDAGRALARTLRIDERGRVVVRTAQAAL